MTVPIRTRIAARAAQEARDEATRLGATFFAVAESCIAVEEKGITRPPASTSVFTVDVEISIAHAELVKDRRYDSMAGSWYDTLECPRCGRTEIVDNGAERTSKPWD